MAAYSSTEIRKPDDDTDFEQKCVVLFRGVLSDPSVQRLGTSGQEQDGVDLIGRRDGDPNRLVGIQCKVKTGNGKLTEKEVREEVTAALTYRPPLAEYLIVTTAKNDTRIQQYAQRFAQERNSAGRRILIDVWGWNTLTEHINNDQAAKNAFDPGFSPSLAAQTVVLRTLVEGQGKLPTREQVAGIAASLDQLAAVEMPKLPSKFANAELTAQLSRVMRRRGFGSTDPARELGDLADEVLNGDLTLASNSIRLEVLDRAARATAQPLTIATAERNLAAARHLSPARDLTIAEALVNAAKGDTDAAIRVLRDIAGSEGRSALFKVLLQARGAAAALDWARAATLTPTDFGAHGALNLVLTEINNGDYDSALASIKATPHVYLQECPALYLLRAHLALASVLPADQRAAIFQGLPLDPSALQLASGPSGQTIIKAANADVRSLLALLPDLELGQLEGFLSEFELWLELETYDSKDTARARIATEIGDPATTLRRVRLALAYSIPFNREALGRHLDARKDLGGWSQDERFAAFLLAFYGGDPQILADFYAHNHDELFAEGDLAVASLAGIEIEALARAGRFPEAHAHLALHTRTHLSEEQAKEIGELLSGIESGDEVERLRGRYEASKQLGDLRMLVNALRAKRDHRQLATYAPILARAARTQDEFNLALQTMYQSGRYRELVALTDELPELYGLNDEFASLKGWALFQLGRVLEGRSIARELWSRRAGSGDRELSINTAVETGDWGYLQAILTKEAERIDELPANEAMRLARLALEANSPYLDRFRDAALKKAPEDPQINLAAYVLALERGDEYQGSQAHAWFQKAAERSGPEGPVQSMSMREMVDRTKGWNEHAEQIDQLLREAKVPLFVAAKALRRQVMDFALGQALRNAAHADARAHYPVFAFARRRPPLDTAEAKAPALDITSMATLDYLGLLEPALQSFEQVIIAPRTLGMLFAERQFLRVGQPSQTARARRIQTLITSGKLKVLPQGQAVQADLARTVGPDLVALLETAQREGGLVVRSAPVFKLGSFLDETMDLDMFAPVLTDTLSVLSFLSQAGRIDAPTEKAAGAYLRQVDKGWPNAQPIGAKEPLYLDHLSVIYLDYVGLLEPVIRAAAAVFAPQDVADEASNLLRYAEFTDDLLAAVERIRSAVEAGLERGAVKFSSRRHLDRKDKELDRKDKEDEEEDFDQFPTLDLLSDLSSVDVAFSDDRCLNKEPFWADAAARRIPAGSTLDLLLGLKNGGRLDVGSYWNARHRLRVAGYYAVPLEPEELQYHLARAPVAEGVVRETPELRAVRESIALPQMARSFMETEGHWLVTVRHAVFHTLREIWLTEENLDAARTKGDWLLSIMPDPLAWCPDPDDEVSWAAARQQTAAQVGLITVFVSGEGERRDRYFGWLEDRLLAPLRANQPELWEAALEFTRTYLPRLTEIDDDPIEK